MNAGDLKPFSISQDIINKYVKSTRVRAGRSISGCSLPAFTNEQDRKQVEDYLIESFKTLDGDLKGT